ncbi:hypothetical protein Dda_6895 [Drechslerella dactyloides]|uniref:Uncharacterized protein n=1 Tax=Drechslerella dactyloides TaxID=74499 RepID=A0AAD6IWG8_DREDA|nr:hypothetical protein Dda_6895 [Drechslerella dactyloides]
MPCQETAKPQRLLFVTSAKEHPRDPEPRAPAAANTPETIPSQAATTCGRASQPDLPFQIFRTDEVILRGGFAPFPDD